MESAFGGRRITLAALVAGTLWAAAVPVHAQKYPSKPVRVIVPFAPGGGSDIAARQFSAKLSEAFGQQFVVDNRGGAGGLIGMELTAKALPDMKKNLESQGMAPTGGSPQRYGERIRKDYDRWVKLIKEANIKAD